MGQNRIEKIVQRYAVGLPEGQMVRAGDFVTVRPRHVLTHDNSSAVMAKFRSIGAAKIHDPSQPVFPMDHDVQNKSKENLAKYASIESFANEHGIAFFPPGTGIGHQIMMEEGFVIPGSVVVGSDSHSNLYGALGALGTPVVRTDAAAIWASGETWWQVPPVVKVVLTGELSPGVSGKDLIIALIGHFASDEVLNHVLEFEGDGVASLTMDNRMAVSNMTTEWGALAGVFPYDSVARDYLHARASRFAERGDLSPRITAEMIAEIDATDLGPDAGAYYAKEVAIDLAAITPHVAGPNSVKKITPVVEIEQKKVRIDKAYLLSCVGGRLEDIAAAAEVLALCGGKVADSVEMYVAAASAEIEERAKEAGYWSTLMDGGAKALPPGCGPCIGLGEGTLEADEVGISATNRNFKGRMGHPDSKAYLASPAVVAASAAAGYIAAMPGCTKKPIGGTIKEYEAPAVPAEKITIRDGFPKSVEGRLLLIPEDNLNTDGIYGKDYTYRDDLSPEQMGAVAFENYDPKFQEVARNGDLVVGGWNFGTGSSREQAATAIAYRGIRMVIAGSYSQTYKRNAFNNGFVVIECPRLVEALRRRFAASEEATIDTGITASVDFESSTLVADGESYTFAPLREVAQELVALGGLESLLRNRIGNG